MFDSISWVCTIYDVQFEKEKDDSSFIMFMMSYGISTYVYRQKWIYLAVDG